MTSTDAHPLPDRLGGDYETDPRLRLMKHAQVGAWRLAQRWRTQLPGQFYARLLSILADEQHPIQDPGPLYDWDRELVTPIREYGQLEKELAEAQANQLPTGGEWMWEWGHAGNGGTLCRCISSGHAGAKRVKRRVWEGPVEPVASGEPAS